MGGGIGDLDPKVVGQADDPDPDKISQVGEVAEPLIEGKFRRRCSTSEACRAIHDRVAFQPAGSSGTGLRQLGRDGFEGPTPGHGQANGQGDENGLDGDEEDHDPVHAQSIAQRRPRQQLSAQARARYPVRVVWTVPVLAMASPNGLEDALRLRLIPREERFFDLFAEDAANVLGASRLLEAMLRSFDVLDRRAGEIRDAEHRGDELSHEIGHRLEATFVTPFDREDIHALISGLDDILDLIEEVADTFVLYRIEAPTPVAIQQASIVVRQCEQLHEALTHLRGFRGLEKYWIEVHRLENEGDQLARRAIAGLFSGGGDVLEVVKWKDVYALLEATIDKCEDVANVIERITIKHA